MIPRISPDHLVEDSNYPHPTGFAGELFCRLIDTDYFLFVFGKASLLSAACMAVDRWYAVAKPLLYRQAFSERKLVIYLTTICCLSIVLPLYKPFTYSYHYTAEHGYECSGKKTFESRAQQVWRPVYTIVTATLPCLVTWAAFIHIWKLTRESPTHAHACAECKERADQTEAASSRIRDRHLDDAVLVSNGDTLHAAPVQSVREVRVVRFHKTARVR